MEKKIMKIYTLLIMLFFLLFSTINTASVADFDIESMNEFDAKEIFEDSEICYITPPEMNPSTHLYHKYMLKCKAKKVWKISGVAQSPNDFKERKIREISVGKYKDLFDAVYKCQIWNLDSITSKMIKKKPEEFLQFPNLRRGRPDLSREYEIHIKVNGKMHTFFVAASDMTNLQDFRYYKIFRLIFDFFRMEEVIEYDESNIDTVLKKSIADNMGNVLFDSEIGYIMEWTGMSLGAAIRKFSLKSNSNKCKIVRGVFFPDGSYKEKLESISKRKYKKTWKAILNYDILTLKSANPDTIFLNINTLEDVYGNNLFRHEAYNYIFFVRVGNKQHTFTVYDLNMLKDKRYSKIVEVFNKVFL